MKKITLFILCLITINIDAQLTNISPNDLDVGDQFGFVVDINGDDLLLNASSSNALQEDLGALYHYRFNGSEWQLNQKILPLNEEIQTSSGMGLWSTISDDWIAASIVGNNTIRSVVFYKRENGGWIRHSKISNNLGNTFFGWQVKLDGNQAIISAINDYNQDEIQTGVAYIYDYNSATDTWEQTAKFSPEDLEEGDLFGGAVYIKDDLAAIASRNDNDNGEQSGAVYVFEKEQGNWNQTAKIISDDGMAGDRFGYRIDGDGNKLIISGFGSDNETGGTYIFRKENGWIQEARLVSQDLSEGDWFGSSVAIDGNLAIVGARNHTGEAEKSGAFFVFENEGLDWVQRHIIIDPNGQADDYLGGGLDLENEKLVVSGFGYNEISGAAFSINLIDLVSTKIESNLPISIYPNPSYENLVLDTGDKQIKEIEIYSIDGELIRSFKHDGAAIDISNLSAGSYFLRSKSDALYIGKFIKI